MNKEIKLQASKGLSVVPSDTVDIPYLGAAGETGTATSTSASKLVDSAANFLAVSVGDIVRNTTSNTYATVTRVDSATEVALSSDIISSGSAYTTYRMGENSSCVLYIGGAGDVAIETFDGNQITLAGVNAGQFLPVMVRKVLSTGTTATNIVALW